MSRRSAVPSAVIPLLFVLSRLARSGRPVAQSTVAVSQAAGVTIAGTVVDAALTPLTGVAVTLERDGRVVAKATTSAAACSGSRTSRPVRIECARSTRGFPVLTRDVRVPVGVDVVQLPIVLARPQDALPDARREARRPVADRLGTAAASASSRLGAASGQHGVQGGSHGRDFRRGGGGGRGGGNAVMRQTQGQASRSRARQTAAGLYLPYRRAAWSGYRYRHSGERYAHVEPNRFQSALDASALDVRRRRRHGVVHERPPIPVAGPAAAARRRARRGVRQLLPVRLRRAARTASRSR